MHFVDFVLARCIVVDFDFKFVKYSGRHEIVYIDILGALYSVFRLIEVPLCNCSKFFSDFQTSCILPIISGISTIS